MVKKRINKILWYGDELEEGKAKKPGVAEAGGNGLDGLNRGEVYICDADEDPVIFIRTRTGKVVRIGGGDFVSKETLTELLNLKLDKSVFDDLFEKVVKNDVTYIKAKYNFYSVGEVAAGGAGSGSGGSTGGGIDEVQLWAILGNTGTEQIAKNHLTTALTGYATEAWVNEKGYATQSWVLAKNYLTSAALSGYATQSWVTSQGYITNAALEGYATQSWVTEQGYATTSALANYVTLAAFNNAVATLNASISTKLDKSVFDDLFEKVTQDGQTFIKAKYNLFSVGEVAAGGAGSSSGGTSGGIDEEQLWSILANTGTEQISKTHLTTALTDYATKAWVTAQGYATQSWVTAKGYITNAALEGYATIADVDNRIDDLINGAPAAYDTLKEIADVLQGNVDSIGDIITTLGTKADKAISISAGTGLTGGGNLSASRTLSLATVGTAGTYTKVTVDAYGRVTGHSSLVAADIPTLSISKISGLQTALDSKLNASVFNDLFEKVTQDGQTFIKAKYNFYSVGEVAAGGAGSGSGGSTGGGIDETQLWSILGNTGTQQISKTHLTDALSGYATEMWVTNKGYATQSWVTNKGYITADALSGYATEEWVDGKGYLTAITKAMVEKVLTGDIDSHTHSQYLTTHQSIYALTVKGNTTTAMTYNPKSAAATLTIASGSNISLTVDAANKKITIANTYSYTHPTATATTISAATGKVLSAITVNNLGHVTSVSAKTLAAGDIPTLSVSKISGLQSSLDSKLNASVFNDLFEKVTEDGQTFIKAKYNFYSVGEVAAGGAGSGSGGTGSGIDEEQLWSILSNTGNEQIAKNHLTTALANYATQSWVTSQNYLKAVRLATISDLHASWDALLKVAPSAYITRWPSVSEVTSKQNLIIKLNSGTTEGTSMFTYNVTAAKTVNITPSAIGAAARSHNHSWANITSGKPTTLAGYGITDGVNTVSVTGSGNAITAASISGHTLTLTKGSTFLLSSAYTAADILAKLKTVDGSGSGLDADTVDTYGASSLFRENILSPKDLDANNLVTNYILYTTSGDMGTGDWANIKFTNFPTSKPEGSFSLLVVREGIYQKQIYGAYNDNHIYVRSKAFFSGTVKWKEWNKLAFVTDNVASATKLQTPRTIWGKSFDGTANVSGDMSGVDSITGSGTLNLIGTSNVTLKYGNDDTKSVILNGTSFKPYNVANNNIDLGASITRWRNVYSVLGNFSGLITATAGLTTPQYIQIGSGRIYWDATNNALYVKKSNGTACNFYSLGEIASGGAGTGSGGTGEGIDEEQLWAILGNTGNEQIAKNHLTSALAGYLTSVSLSTIKDLHANWDAVLKVAPTSYVTRWPSFAEVTAKPTTLSGYGITDAVTIETTQTITGVKTFSRNTASVMYLKNSADTSNYVALRFMHKDSDVGGIAGDKDGSALYRVNSGFTTVYKLLDTSNYSTTLDTRYVKKSGDTMTGSLKLETNSLTRNIVYSDSGTDNIIFSDVNGSTVVRGSNISFQNVVGSSIFQINENVGKFTNTPLVGTFKIWHEGNGGAGSGLNADLLDGKHYSDIINENVASATKLQTARTIWGQSFDGTKNISGSITGVGTITFTGNPFLFFNNGVNYIIGNSGKNTLVNANIGNLILGYRATNAIDFYAGSTTIDAGTPVGRWNSTGLGVGTSSPSYKLHVVGTMYVSDATILASTLSVASTSTFTGKTTHNGGIGVTNISATGNIQAQGELAAGATSDKRLKNILQVADYQKRLLALGNVVDYEYNNKAFQRKYRTIEHRRYTGLIYQNVVNVLPQMAGKDDDGYGYLNYIHTDYINLIAGALQQTIRRQETIEQRVARLERENEELRRKIAKLAA